MIYLRCGLAVAGMMAAFPACAYSSQLDKALALTPASFLNSAKVSDDALDTSATITTEPGFRETHGLLKIVWDDTFLRGFIDKKTGRGTYQVYQFISYVGPSWRNYQTVNYEAPGGPRQVATTKIDSGVDCSSVRLLGGCTYKETVIFEVNEDDLRKIAALYQPGARVAWQMKFGAQDGTSFPTGVLPAEVAGFMMAIDYYRASHKLDNPAPDPVAMPPSAPVVSQGYSVADEITKLASLRDKGILTAAEFDQQKAALLAKERNSH